MAIGGAQPGNVSLRWMRFGSPWRIETKIPYFRVGRRWGSGENPRCNPSTTHTSFWLFSRLFNSPSL